MTVKSGNGDTVIGKNTAVSIGLLLGLLGLGSPLVWMAANLLQVQTRLDAHEHKPIHDGAILRREFEAHVRHAEEKLGEIAVKLDRLLQK